MAGGARRQHPPIHTLRIEVSQRPRRPAQRVRQLVARTPQPGHRLRIGQRIPYRPQQHGDSQLLPRITRPRPNQAMTRDQLPHRTSISPRRHHADTSPGHIKWPRPTRAPRPQALTRPRQMPPHRCSCNTQTQRRFTLRATGGSAKIEHLFDARDKKRGWIPALTCLYPAPGLSTADGQPMQLVLRPTSRPGGPSVRSSSHGSCVTRNRRGRPFSITTATSPKPGSTHTRLTSSTNRRIISSVMTPS